jgi:hypothetical protein
MGNFWGVAYASSFFRRLMILLIDVTNIKQARKTLLGINLAPASMTSDLWLKTVQFGNTHQLIGT